MEKAKINYFVDIVAFVSFLITAVTGLIIFLFLPPGERNGGLHNTLFGYGRHDWGNVHDWAGIVMLVAALVHIAMHWSWLVAMTKNYFSLKNPTA